jgi:hypothetical protein
MPRVGFERKVPMIEQAKTIHALDPWPTVIGAIALLLYMCIMR